MEKIKCHQACESSQSRNWELCAAGELLPLVHLRRTAQESSSTGVSGEHESLAEAPGCCCANRLLLGRIFPRSLARTSYLLFWSDGSVPPSGQNFSLICSL